jgi:hypothetical protein
MRLVFQCTCLDVHITLCHTEYKLATRDAMSHLAIPGMDFFSDGLSTPTKSPEQRIQFPSPLLLRKDRTRRIH